MTSGKEKKLGVVLQYSQMALGIVISLVYTPAMLRILGQSQYGLYNLASSVVSYLSLFSLGFGSSYIRFYSRYKKDNDDYGIRRLNGLFLRVFGIMGGAALICGLVLSANVSAFFNESYSAADLKTAKVLMIFMTVNLAISFPVSVFSSYVSSQQKFVFLKLLGIVGTVVSPLLTLPVLLMGYGSIGMILVGTVTGLVSNIVMLWFCFSRLRMRFEFGRPDWKLLKEIAFFSFFIALNQIVDQINWATDKVVLGKFCTSGAVAIYAIGSQMNSHYLSLSTAISGVFVPQVNQIAASGEEEQVKNMRLTRLLTKVGRVQFIVLMLVLTGFIFFGRFFIMKWAGDEYEKSYWVALLLIVPVTVPLIQNVGIEIQRAKNMHQFRGYIYFCMALINVVISIFLAQLWGEVGAAVGTAASLVLANGLVMNWFYHKKIGLDMRYFWKHILSFSPAFILPVAAGLLLNIKECVSLTGFVVRVIIYTIVYTVSMYLWGINEFEKEQVRSILRKLKISGKSK